VLGRFRAGGGEHVMIANIDNLGAGLDEVVIGWHIASGAALTCEVVDAEGERGGLPVRWNDRAVILEDFRVPASFDRSTVPVFNTNTFTVSAAALEAYDAPWTWFPVTKEVDGVPVIQRERLMGELTSHLDTRFLHVDRAGERSRFLPVKDLEDLERRRPAIRAVLEARGIIDR
jgi:UTP--glucose-1-phosphate uridylyltransferase